MLSVTLLFKLEIEIRVLKNTGTGETRPFCQIRNPGLRPADISHDILLQTVHISASNYARVSY